MLPGIDPDPLTKRRRDRHAMMPWAAFLVDVAIIVIGQGEYAMTVASVQMFSDSLGKLVTYKVLLPEVGEGPFPVLLQLHGLTDDCNAWIERSNIVRYAAKYPMLVVLPDGGTSGYLNWKQSERLHKHRYEDFLMEDIPQHLKRHFNVARGPWAIGGLSMGGYGAMRLGLKYPDRFASIWAHSSAFHIHEYVEPALAVADPKDADVHWHAERLAQSPPKSKPVIAFDCGTDDRLIEGNREFHRLLERLGIEHHYAEHPGGHDWEYWDEHVQTALAQHARVLGAVFESN